MIRRFHRPSLSSSLSSTSTSLYVNQFRTWSSSSFQNNSNNNNNVHLIVSELLSITKGPNNWIPIRNVSPQLSDDACEAMSEQAGGIRQFIEATPEASALFEIKFDAAGVPLLGQKFVHRQSSSSPSPTDCSNTNQKKNMLESILGSGDDIPLRPVSAEAEDVAKDTRLRNRSKKTHYFRSSTDNNNNNESNNNAFDDSQVNEFQKRFEFEDPLLKNQRALVCNIPSFPVPLVEVLKRDCNVESVDALTLENVRKFAEKGNAHFRQFVDLFVPFSTATCSYSSSSPSQHDPWKTLMSLSDESSKATTKITSIQDLKDMCYISLLPPFVETHCNREVDEFFEANGDFLVGDYDMCRLARHLSSDNFVSVSSLLRSSVPSLLQKPLLHVIAAYPLQFEYLPPGSKIPENTFVASVVDSCAAAFEKGCPPVSVHHQVEEDSNSVFSSEQADLGCVRFILHPEELDNGLGVASKAIRVLPLDLLQDLYKLVQDRTIDKETAIREGPRFGLKKVPTGMARIRAKHQIIRSMIRLRFPDGNPFFDRNVFAHYIFDHLPETKPISLPQFRDYQLQEQGRTAAPLSSEFVQSYPHLFLAIQDERNEWILQRADAAGKERIEVKKEEDLTIDDIVMLLWMRKPPKYDSSMKSGIATMAHMLPMVAQNRARHFGGVREVMKMFPGQFRVIEDDPEFFYWGEPPTNFVETMRVNEMQQENKGQIQNKPQPSSSPNTTTSDANTRITVLSVEDVLNLEEEKKMKMKHLI